MSKYWGFSSTPYLSVFSANVGKYRPEKPPYVDTFNVVKRVWYNVKKDFCNKHQVHHTFQHAMKIKLWRPNPQSRTTSLVLFQDSNNEVQKKTMC